MTSNTQARKETLTQRLARGILRIPGWQAVGKAPELKKLVIIGAHHTSNWDFIYGLLMMYALGFRFKWIGKASLFKPPFGWLFYRLGGIPVKRDRSHNYVSQIAEAFEKSDSLYITITPEGTRSYTRYWKTGFYYMAIGANVPIMFGFIDYSRKQTGLGPLLHPSGDIYADFEKIRAFYADKVGRYPENQGLIEIRPKE